MSELGPTKEIQIEEVRPRILLADDSATIRKVVELTFADEGIDVTAVADAVSAMQQFVDILPDIVLVDTSLSGTSGYQICEMIKQDKATAHIPVLLLVGSFEPFDHDEAERVGADGFLMKPFNSIRELTNRVKELLEQPASHEVQLEEIRNDSGENKLKPANDNVYRMSDFSETNDIENLYERSFVDTAEIQEFETVDDVFSDSALDDELIDASYHRDTGFRSTLPDVDMNVTQEQIKDFDWSPASKVTSPGSGEIDTDQAIDPNQQSAHPTLTELPEHSQVRNSEKQIEPTNEFIALVAERVVERLSERAIRDVAKEVVPRIAEKLIREALAEENKT